MGANTNKKGYICCLPLQSTSPNLKRASIENKGTRTNWGKETAHKHDFRLGTSKHQCGIPFVTSLSCRLQGSLSLLHYGD